jgi:hypothetical protein
MKCSKCNAEMEFLDIQEMMCCGEVGLRSMEGKKND